MRVKLFWLGLSLLLAFCVLLVPTAMDGSGGSIFGRLFLPFLEEGLGRRDEIPRWSIWWILLAFLTADFAVYVGMECLLGRIRMKTRWAIGIGLPCTTYGVGVFVVLGLYLFLRAVHFFFSFAA